MPRGKAYHRSESNRWKLSERPFDLELRKPRTYARRGTGYRHKVQEWPISTLTGRSHKLVIPAESPDKKFVLLIGDSHLRSIADGYVEMPKGYLDFGVMSTPGANAAELTVEVEHADVPTPDVVCLLAPSNNLTASRTPEEAGVDFYKLLFTVSNRWPNKVFVLDFPPRLNVDVAQQDFFRQEFHRISVRMGIKYLSTVASFPLTKLKLWSKDGVHLSDDHGMNILAQLIWDGANQQLARPASPSTTEGLSRPPSPTFTPKIVVKGKTVVPRGLDPFKWILVGPGGKRKQDEKLERSRGVACKKIKIEEEEEEIVLKECFIPLTPVWFSGEMLEAMNQLVPADLSSRVERRVVPKVVPKGKKEALIAKYGPRVTASKRTLANSQRKLKQSCDVRHKKRKFQHEDVLKECFIPLTRVPLSSATLDAMDEAVPKQSWADVVRYGRRVGASKSLTAQATQSPVVDESLASSSTANEILQEEATQSPVVDESLSSSSTAKEALQEEATQSPVVDDSLSSSSTANEVLQEEATQSPVVDESLSSSSTANEVLQEEATQSPVVDESLASSSTANEALQEELQSKEVSHMQHTPRISPKSIQTKTTGDANKSVRFVLESDITLESLLTDLNTSESHSYTEGSNINPISFGHDRCLNGSFHQGDSRLNHPGKQCMAIAYVGLAKHTISSVFSWCSTDLDEVVVLGDSLYTWLRNNNKISGSNDYLNGDELPKQLVLEGKKIQFENVIIAQGFLSMVNKTKIEEGGGVTLLGGLRTICDEVEACLLTMGCYTSAIICQNGQYAVLDSHARSACGMPDTGGKSVIVYFSRLQDVYGHICNLIKMTCEGQTLFEFSGLRVEQTGSYEKSIEGLEIIVLDSPLLMKSSMSLRTNISKTLKSHDDASFNANVLKSHNSTTLNADVLKSHDATALNTDVQFVGNMPYRNMEISSKIIQRETTIAHTNGSNDNFHPMSLGAPSVSSDGHEETVSQQRKMSLRSSVSKTLKSHDAASLDADIQFVGCVTSKTMQFEPIGKETALAICTRLKLEFEKPDAPESATVGLLGIPCQKEKIVNDGNCFFRAVAQAVSGSQKNHRKIRLAVVKQMESNAVKYKTFLRREYSSVEEYIKKSKMRNVGSWATEVEIQAAADCLGVNIFTYLHDKWLQYSSNSKQGIYLENCNGNHYETVICVHNAQLQSCYGFCKVETSDAKAYNFRWQNIIPASCINLETKTIDTAETIANNYSKYLMEKYKHQKKMKYQDNMLHRQNVRDMSMKAYHQNPEKKKEISMKAYHQNPDKKRKISMKAYHQNPDKKRKISMKAYYQNPDKKRKISMKAYYQNPDKKRKISMKAYYQNPEKKKEISMKAYDQNPEKKKEISMKAYHQNPEKKKEISMKAYHQNPLLKEKKKERSINKYRQNTLHKGKVKEMSIKKYRQNTLHKEKVKEMSIKKYRQNTLHKEKVKEISIKKYRQNAFHKEKVKEMSIKKYRQNAFHKEKVKEMSIKKYRQNALHRQNVKLRSTNKYHNNPEHKKNVKVANKLRMQNFKEKLNQFDFVMENFLDKVKNGPEFVCSVCHRLMFKRQVSYCKRDHYKKMSSAIELIANKCITEEYLHKCNEDCVVPCKVLESARGQLWICFTCNSKIMKGEIPPECVINNLTVQPIPPKLSCLNSLEQHLIALHIPFMKMLALPKGGQNGVHGPVTCVPANIVQTNNLLPRSNMEGSLLPVKLKRKITYKGHYEYQFVDTMRIRQALQYLKQTNVHYKDIHFNEAWINEFCRKQDEVVENVNNTHVGSGEKSAGVEDELLHDRQQHCMFQDTCLMPVDIGQEALDQYFDNVLNLAPAEGNNPVKLLSDHTNEAKCFPVLFPQGQNTYYDSRPYRLTLARYFNNRILHADGRFAQNVEYIFFAQYMVEIEQVMSNVSIALRKGNKGQTCQRLSDDLLNNEESLKTLLQCDEGYRFLKPIRGTPAFWQKVQRDLIACVRQLGVPTWFCSFSSADLRWQTLLYSILKTEGRTQTVEDLEWADKCELLRHNPVAAARYFDFRWHIFLREVIMSDSNPIGKILDYFHRVEFQQRGSPHTHCFFWIFKAPQIDKNTDEEVCEFIDKYVTCELPSDDESLLDTVKSVQEHSKQHTKTCKKKGTDCRFHYPKPASLRTFICRCKTDEHGKTQCKCKEDNTANVAECTCENEGQKHPAPAKEIMKAIKTALSDKNASYNTVEDLFESLGIDQAMFEDAYQCISRNTHVVLKRDVNEVWVNPYNKSLLKCWNANMDIQFVIDAYACIVYIISYISKSEREMGLLLSNAQREAAKEGNISAKDALKNLGSVYLHNREVCAQEAVYRLTNMHLKECSRKVVFVPTGDNQVKMSLPLNVLRQKAASQNLTTEDMWMTSNVDRYQNRPNDLAFNDMCMATFASEYRVLSKNEKSKNRIKLNNDYGFITKRTRTKPAVVRYMRFSETKNPESFYQSMLQLFLPYRVEAQLKPPNCELFEQFYKNGQMMFSDGSRHSVKSVVDLNRSKFEIEANELETVQNMIDSDGVLENAWCELFPEQELERLECEEERKNKDQTVDEHVENIPDLAVSNQKIAHLEKRNNILSRSDGLALIRSLNETQLSVFYQIRQWCLEKVAGKNPDPLHVFITGGAGTGKSHLIKAIQYEATRLLSTLCRLPDNICVLITAPTGIAAYNLHASTIHHTFSIGKDCRLPYTPLGEEKLNSLRANYSDLQLLIIDEISMVDHKMLSYIHGRLRQIKQTGDLYPFGKVSVIAVGDFFQLPPVKGKPLYVDDVGFNLWFDRFRVVELTDIVRQKDHVFAELLNRIRTRSKGSPMLKTDIEALKRCETGEESTALHIFPTNKQVNEYNIQQLIKICPEYIEIGAQDFVLNKKNGKLELKSRHHANANDTCLAEKLLLGKDARVMLCKNVDVTDGLVNGVCGTVTHIVTSPNERFPQKVYVKFDDDQVGAQRRKQSAGSNPSVSMGSTAVEPEEERVTKQGGLRRQFPLKLAWACTIHKVQGITVDKVVVSLKKVFSAGQAYVALSRVTSLPGLVIQDFEDKALYCKDNIKDAIESMPKFLVENMTKPNLNTHTFSVFMMNVQNLPCHVADLVLRTQHLQLNCIAVTETWLPDAFSLETVKIDGYSFHSAPRSLAYSGNNPTLVALQQQQHGGVGMYVEHNTEYHILKLPNVNLECLAYQCVTYNILVAIIYRPPSYPMFLFKENFGKLLDWLDPLSNTIAIMGDFNEDLLKSSTIHKLVTDKGYTQLVTQPTTEKGTLIDHVYVKTTNYDVQSIVLPTYFSDHEGVLCSFTSK
ncbi:uncharacterized protein LOC144019426 isoform X12 [Festucalex cinctus]